MDFFQWLRDIGLAQHEERLRAAAIDEDVVEDLTEADLEALGLPLGDRKRLLRAIAARRSPDGALATPSAGGDRRQLTLMFCDMVGSTELSTRMDPEDMSDLIRRFQNAVEGVVETYDGRIAKWMGDGALIYFGYPTAHEDDAERAVRAGLAVMQALTDLRDEYQFVIQARAGVATGLVVVGELMGSGFAQERGVVGDTPNLAARLQALAEPGQVIVSDTTRRLLGETFELQALPPQALKGFPGAVVAWRALRQREHVSRFDASRSGSLGAFVGREAEIAHIVERWRRAEQGRGQVVWLSGEAGIGKSRILAALRERVGAASHTALYYQCAPYHTNTPLYPVYAQLRRAAGFTDEDSPRTRLDKLQALVVRSGLDPAEAVPLLAGGLSVPPGDRFPPLEGLPAEIRERTIRCLIDLFAGLARREPLLALWEDAHWMDPTSLDLSNRLIERIADLPALLVVTSRPEFSIPWEARPHLASLTLARLELRDALRLIDRVAEGKGLPPDVTAEIVAKADGVPLFLEELTKTVLESGMLREERDRFVLIDQLAPLAIPTTLQDSLTARLDRLAPVREIAQIGAAIGREFSYRLIAAAAPQHAASLREGLERLEEAGLIFSRGVAPDSHYTFKHALVQDAAYNSLLRARRRVIHAAIAEALQSGAAGAGEGEPETLAHHYAEATQYEPAVRNWLAAGEAALKRSANVEAGRFAESGLALLGRLPDSGARRQLELSLQFIRANSLLAVRGYTTKETIDALYQVKALLDSGVGADIQRFSIGYGLWAAMYVGGRIDASRKLAAEYLALAEGQSDSTYLVIGHRIVGAAAIMGGRFREGLTHTATALSHYDLERHRPLSYLFGQDIGISSRCHQVWSLAVGGQVRVARGLMAEILAELPGHGHATTVAFCTLQGGVLPSLFLRDWDAAATHAAELVRYCQERKTGANYVLAGGTALRIVTALRTPSPDAAESVRAERDALQATGTRLFEGPFTTGLAEAWLAAGDPAQAQRVLEDAIEKAESGGCRYWLAELRRTLGRAILALDPEDRDTASGLFAEAAGIAREQDAALLELRALVDWIGCDAGAAGLSERIEGLLESMGPDEDAEEIRGARGMTASLRLS